MSRRIGFAALYNFRDIGGYPGAAGRAVRWGRYYRSDSLGKLHGPDWDRFQSLGVRTVLDLRHGYEGDAVGRVPPAEGLRYRNISVERQPYDQASQPPGVDPAEYLSDRYAELAADGTAGFAKLLTILAAEGSAPVVVHCAAGKDRTGVLTAIVLALLGVADDDIVADYALTGQATAKIVAEWKREHPGQTPSWPAFGEAPAGAMRLFLDKMAGRYGSLTGYAARELGAGPALVAALRRQFLEPSPGPGRRPGQGQT